MTDLYPPSLSSGQVLFQYQMPIGPGGRAGPCSVGRERADTHKPDKNETHPEDDVPGGKRGVMPAGPSGEVHTDRSLWLPLPEHHHSSILRLLSFVSTEL